MSDTCNSARLAKKLLAELISQQVRDVLGDKWETMSEGERDAAVRTHQCDCWQHLRNIMLAEMSRAQARQQHAERDSVVSDSYLAYLCTTGEACRD